MVVISKYMLMTWNKAYLSSLVCGQATLRAVNNCHEMYHTFSYIHISIFVSLLGDLLLLCGSKSISTLTSTSSTLVSMIRSHLSVNCKHGDYVWCTGRSQHSLWKILSVCDGSWKGRLWIKMTFSGQVLTKEELMTCWVVTYVWSYALTHFIAMHRRRKKVSETKQPWRNKFNTWQQTLSAWRQLSN